MSEIDNSNEGYFDRLDEVASRGDSWPEWKTTGWALLDFEESLPTKTTSDRDETSHCNSLV